MNTAHKPNMVAGLFRDRSSAERAYRRATERGYGREDIDVVMSDDTRQRDFSAAGAGVGGGIGAALATAAAMSSVGLPGLGIVVTGPLAVVLAGAGGLAGGVLGALFGAGMPQEKLHAYEDGIRRGGILVGVYARDADEAQALEEEWHNSAADHVLGPGVDGAPVAMPAAVRPIHPSHAAAGAVGALAGSAPPISALLNTDEERIYWQDHYRNEHYYDTNFDFDDYEPAYMLGYTARQRYVGSWNELEPQLQRDWQRLKGMSRMDWPHAREAVRAAYERELP